ncbi:MAG: Tim44 domain-containing protein [Smithellaceae bacterium]|nr:Tim44 domain-containing protein [Smithellaceae bacterium]
MKSAFARAGGGRSFGSRGARSFSAPRSPAATQASPSRQMGQSAPNHTAPMGAQQGGGFLRGMAGGIAGGIIGGMLFRSLGLTSSEEGGEGGEGIGLFEILLIGLILYGIWWFVKKKRREAEMTARAGDYREMSMTDPGQSGGGDAALDGSQAAEADIDAGLRHIRQLDHAFDEKGFKDQRLDNFFQLQGAWANRDMSPLRDQLTSEMYDTLQADAKELKNKRLINRLENIAVRAVDLSEVWQESGRDFITVRFYANLLDYTTDEGNGQVVSGSKTDPVKFEEFWTFTRQAGNNPWQLAAINQA